eukprot:TRINITY_DN526_c0_g1_i1.p2 TRINITY_DN526_c0_g1~~TRINITY_DN526_c0_g1_i1.p2  ORF type:complete len:259 (-),score=17.43 TRINITY_DN526_c0_g1_i1:319-1095(-)
MPKQELQPQRWQLPVYISDFIISLFWIFTTCTFVELAEWVGQPTGLGQLVGGLVISSVAILSFMPISSGLGGAMFNPVHHAAFYMVGKESMSKATIRAVCQICGGIFGSHAAKALMPPEFQEHFFNLQGGLKGEMGIRLSFQVELIFGVVLNILILVASEAKSTVLALGLPLFANILLGLLGSQSTGPHLNPAETFAWYYQFGSHDVYQHLIAHWLAPFCGAIIAGILYKFFIKRKILSQFQAVQESKEEEKSQKKDQ